MSLMKNILSKASVGALAFGAVVALPSIQAEAATLRIEDLNGVDADFTLPDTGVLQQAATAGVSIGGMIVLIAATPTETAGRSFLNSISVTTAGSGRIRITTSEDGFGAGAGAPSVSQLAFSITSSTLSQSGVLARSFVDVGNGLEAQTDQVGGDLTLNGPISAGTEMARTTDSAVLSNPFSITSVFEIEHLNDKDVTSFDADVLATIPLPAGGLLLLTALGGVAALRRKRKAA